MTDQMRPSSSIPRAGDSGGGRAALAAEPDESFADSMLSWLTDRRVSGLSPTEERVLRLRARGLVNKVVAHDLGISEQTVKSHAASAYHKLGVDSLVGALRALGWITLPDESEPEEQCATVARCGRNADHRGQHGGFRPIFEAEA